MKKDDKKLIDCRAGPAQKGCHCTQCIFIVSDYRCVPCYPTKEDCGLEVARRTKL